LALMPASAPVVLVRGLRFSWPDGAPCLDLPEFEIHHRQQIFLYGPSGCGKSTLLNLLAGVLRPADGTLQMLGADFTKLSPAARDRFRADHIGFIFQQFNLIPYLSVLDNVLLPCRFSRRRRARALEQSPSLHDEAARLLQHLDLDPSLWRRRATALSVGQQQRVAAARALIGRPEVVLADEPTSALDSERQAAFLALLRQECAAAGAAMLFVSHDRRLATGFERELSLAALNRCVTT
jgi:putative ABC transport system ATP-binding protein